MPIVDCQSMRIDLRNQKGAINASVLEQVRNLLLSTTAFNHLVLSGNVLTEDEIATLSVILKDRSALRTLELQNCDLNDSFVCLYIVPAILEHKTLRALNLANNPRLTDRSAEALTQFIVQGDVVALNLVGTAVGERGGAALADALERSSATEVLALPYKVRFPSLHRIACLLQRNVLHKERLSLAVRGAASSVSGVGANKPADAHRRDAHLHFTSDDFSSHDTTASRRCTASMARHALPHIAPFASYRHAGSGAFSRYGAGGYTGKFFLNSLKYCSGPYTEPQVLVNGIDASLPSEAWDEEEGTRSAGKGTQSVTAASLYANTTDLEQMALKLYEQTQQPKRRCALVPVTRDSAALLARGKQNAERGDQTGGCTPSRMIPMNHVVSYHDGTHTSRVTSDDKVDDTLLATYRIDNASRRIVCHCLADDTCKDNALPFKKLVDPALLVPLRCLYTLHDTALQKSELRRYLGKQSATP